MLARPARTESRQARQHDALDGESVANGTEKTVSIRIKEIRMYASAHAQEHLSGAIERVTFHRPEVVSACCGSRCAASAI